MIRFPCLLYTSVLIDCGEGTQVGLREYSIQEKRIDVICLTHYHADHVAGLAGALLAMANAGRTNAVTIIGPPGLGKIINATRVFAPTLPFEICLLYTSMVGLSVILHN